MNILTYNFLMGNSQLQVCKYYLCGFCPSELFTNTRSDVGKFHNISGMELYCLLIQVHVIKFMIQI